jgi:hypothetical protein
MEYRSNIFFFKSCRCAVEEALPVAKVLSSSCRVTFADIKKKLHTSTPLVLDHVPEVVGYSAHAQSGLYCSEIHGTPGVYFSFPLGEEEWPFLNTNYANISSFSCIYFTLVCSQQLLS